MFVYYTDNILILENMNPKINKIGIDFLFNQLNLR